MQKNRVKRVGLRVWLLYSLVFLSAVDLAEAAKIGMVLDKGGKDDQSFGASAARGAARVEKELGVSVKMVHPGDSNAYEMNLRSFATSSENYDLIICVGVSQTEPLRKIASKFPAKQFAIIDSVVDLPNVRSVTFREHEGSFLVGVIAAKKSSTQSLGFIGGRKINLIKKFEAGFRQGVAYVSPKALVTSRYVGESDEAWNNPSKAREIALQLMSGAKADVIYSAAGASGLGLFDAVEEVSKKESKKVFAIGVDTNQNGLKKGLVLTSMIKKVDQAVFDLSKSIVDRTFKGGMYEYDLKNKGLDYAVDENNASLLDAETRKKVEEAKSKIISGEIQVKSTLE